MGGNVLDHRDARHYSIRERGRGESTGKGLRKNGRTEGSGGCDREPGDQGRLISTTPLIRR